MYELKLFVSSIADQNVDAIVKTLEEIIGEADEGMYSLKIIDVIENPEKAQEYQILATPTLQKDKPPPAVRIVGEFASTQQLRNLLGVIKKIK